MYRSAEHPTVASARGPVTYRYQSMTDLSSFADGSFDLVYSGQSIEHVSEDEADVVQIEVPGQRRRGFDPRQIRELVEDEAAVCRPDVTHVDHLGAEYAALTDDVPAAQ